MAFFPPKLLIPSISLCLFSLSLFSLSSSSSSSSSHSHTLITPTDDVHDLLTQYGFPKGLLPNVVKSYSLSDDGVFIIDLDRPCYVQFDHLVYYDKRIKGKLSYGSVSDVSGIQAKELFLWVTVSGINVDSKSGMIEFHVGALSEKLPAKQFETIPNCKNKACRKSHPESI